ncbi:MAG: ceramidase domain-containing protein [Gammaproteobacteria bacterium]|nr:ceramidase domain-containing protein [Gammaproteobacteria bacterium]
MKVRFLLLSVITVSAIVGIFLLPAIPQDPAYHQFVDTRVLFAIPNFWNVISNLPFFVVGLAGLLLLRKGVPQGGLPEMKNAYYLFFIGVFLTTFGSSYYHWTPANHTLVWDRLPMTLGFMGLFAAMVAEFLSVTAGKRLLWPLLVVGVLSVGYWHLTEQVGAGDLRLYALVQFLPMVLIPLMLSLFPGRFRGKRYLWWVIAWYGLSKLLEHFDQGIFLATGISGHSLKHLTAAGAATSFWLALRYRRAP